MVHAINPNIKKPFINIGTFNIQNCFTYKQADFVVNIAGLSEFLRGENSLNQELDILGLQEVRRDCADIANIIIDDYFIVGEQRYSGIMSGSVFSEANSIMVNKNTANIDSSSTVWLSPRFQKAIGSSYLSILPRIATYALVSIDGQDIIYLNTHLHYKKGWSQKKQLEKLLSLIETLKQTHPNIPLILTGDFNLKPKDYEFRKFEDSLSDDLKQIKTQGPTYHGRAGEKHLDYIFIPNEYEVLDVVVDTAHPNIGDHYPTIAKIRHK